MKVEEVRALGPLILEVPAVSDRDSCIVDSLGGPRKFSSPSVSHCLSLCHVSLLFSLIIISPSYPLFLSVFSLLLFFSSSPPPLPPQRDSPPEGVRRSGQHLDTFWPGNTWCVIFIFLGQPGQSYTPSLASLLQHCVSSLGCSGLGKMLR